MKQNDVAVTLDARLNPDEISETGTSIHEVTVENHGQNFLVIRPRGVLWADHDKRKRASAAEYSADGAGAAGPKKQFDDVVLGPRPRRGSRRRAAASLPSTATVSLQIHGRQLGANENRTHVIAEVTAAATLAHHGSVPQGAMWDPDAALPDNKSLCVRK